MSVGGPRHSSQRLRDAAWTCGICGFLNVSGSVCAQCNNDPEWKRPMPQPKPTGAQAARQVMEQLGVNAPPPPPEDEREIHLSLDVTSLAGLVNVHIYGASGERYYGEGVTLQEAVVAAIAAMEEDETRPKCPTCGQHWPEDREFPESEQ